MLGEKTYEMPLADPKPAGQLADCGLSAIQYSIADQAQASRDRRLRTISSR